MWLVGRYVSRVDCSLGSDVRGVSLVACGLLFAGWCLLFACCGSRMYAMCCLLFVA